MGNCTAVIKKKNVRPYGRSNIVEITMSSSYATGGDTVPRSVLGIGNRLSALLLGAGHLSTLGHACEVVYGASEYADPKILLRDVATGTEVANATNVSTGKIYAEVIASPYK